MWASSSETAPLCREFATYSQHNIRSFWLSGSIGRLDSGEISRKHRLRNATQLRDRYAFHKHGIIAEMRQNPMVRLSEVGGFVRGRIRTSIVREENAAGAPAALGIPGGIDLVRTAAASVSGLLVLAGIE